MKEVQAGQNYMMLDSQPYVKKCNLIKDMAQHQAW